MKRPGIVSKQPSAHRQSGMSLMELMVALLLLALGMAATLPLFTMALLGNNRSKIDTQAVLISQVVLEETADAAKTNGTGATAGSVTVMDCRGNQIVDAGGAPVTIYAYGCTNAAGCGCPLKSGTSDIDWTASQSSCAGSYAYYSSCGDTPESRAVYEVRWNIKPVNGLSDSEIVSVSSRLKGSEAGSNNFRLTEFTIPVTLHTLYGWN